LERFKLTTQETGLSLQDTQANFTPIIIDFNQMNLDWKYRGIGKNHDACKAIGLNKLKQNESLTLLDATAGLARDAFIFAKLGASVTMLERHPSLALMIKTALEKLSDESLKQKLRFIFSDAILYLQSNDISYDVIYLDPMFSDVDKRAKVKKDMQLLHGLIGENNDADALLTLALGKAKKRVVVKRHKTSPFLDNRAPNHQIIGKSTRYDVYTKNFDHEFQKHP
jgi:16S rRNA (guanine1516-N2)-methyltransferase